MLWARQHVQFSHARFRAAPPNTSAGPRFGEEAKRETLEVKRKQMQMTDGKSRLDQMGRLMDNILRPVPRAGPWTSESSTRLTCTCACVSQPSCDRYGRTYLCSTVPVLIDH